MIAYNLVRHQWENIVVQGADQRTDRGPIADQSGQNAALSPWFVSPGFFDAQINGVKDIDFNEDSLTVSDVRRVVKTLLAEGVVRFFPTIVTGSDAHTRKILGVLRTACEMDSQVAYAVWGVHIEGPYISELDGPRGAHARAWIRDPRWDEFSGWQAAAGGRIRMITVAPERRGMVDFIRQATASGVVVALGHHAASGDEIVRAVQAGARLTTHFGNGAHASLPRHPNYLWDQLAHPELALSVIGDGIHLPPSVLQVVFRIKPDQTLLVSDRVADPVRINPGSVMAIGQTVTVNADRVALTDFPTLLAGAVTPLNVAIARTAQVVGHLDQVVRAVTTTPAAIMGLPASDLMRDWVVFRLTDAQADVHWVMRDQHIVYAADQPLPSG